MPIDFTEFKQVSLELISDVEIALNIARKDPSGFARRTYVRSFFAMVEGIVYQFKKISIQAHDESSIFDPYEIEILKEKTSDLTDKGTASSKPSKLQLLLNLTFSINSTIKALNLDFRIDKNNGWEFLKKSVRIRDRITHPKNIESLTITDQEVEWLGKSNIWFRELVINISNAINDKHLQITKDQ